MADYKVTDTQLVQIADAIRSKGGTSASIVFPSGFISAVEAIPSGTSMSLISKEISENGTYLPSSDNADAFSSVVVDVPTGGGGVYVSKTITENGTYKPSDDNADAYSQVVVNVSGGGGEGKTKYYNIIIGISSGIYDDPDIVTINEQTFYHKQGINGISLPNAEYLRSSAFEGCVNASFVDLPKCKNISDYAFYGCSSLTSVSIPECSIIGGSAFYDNRDLTEISLPKVEALQRATFRDCASLQTVFLNICSIIYSEAFRQCSNLSTLYLLSNSVVTLSGNSIFQNTKLSSSYGSIYVPASLVDTYKTISGNWYYFSSNIFAYSE